jgi:hypothetical protein
VKRVDVEVDSVEVGTAWGMMSGTMYVECARAGQYESPNIRGALGVESRVVARDSGVDLAGNSARKSGVAEIGESRSGTSTLLRKLLRARR